MTSRTNRLETPLLALPLTLFAPALAADQIFIAGAGGVVLRADAEDEIFRTFACPCTDDITALSTDAEHLYAADAAGTIYTFDLDTGLEIQRHRLALTPTAIAVRGNELFVAGAGGTILRLSRSSGAALADQRSVPTQIHAMAVAGDDLYVGGADGLVYRARAGGGTFSALPGMQFTDVRTMAVIGNSLYVGDLLGVVGQIDLRRATLVKSFGLGTGFNAMAAQGSSLLVHFGGGFVSRINRRVGTAEDYYFSPIAISAMTVEREVQAPGVIQALPTPRAGGKR